MNTKAHILVVDDDDLLRKTLGADLQQSGYTVGLAASGSAALAYVERQRVDLVILDIGLPDNDGIEVARALRRDRLMPIIFLTARSSEIDKVQGILMGDDYVTKPFSLLELEARITSLLRRIQPEHQATLQDIREIGNVRIDVASHQVTSHGEPIKLSPKEFELLHLLMSRAGQVLTLNEILVAVWGEEYAGAHDLVHAHISWLRKKIRPNPTDPELIVTVRGIGYRFVQEA